MVAKLPAWLLLALSVFVLACASKSAAPRLPTATSVSVATSTPAPPDTSAYPVGAVGYAISWPQCGAAYPDEPFDFGIIGVTNGQSFTDNPCFEDEYRWAEHGRYQPSIYINTSYNETIPPTSGMGTCARNMVCRARVYGESTARAAYDYAASVDAVAPVWWLDVQIVSDWSEDPTLNAASIAGAADFLRSKGIRVGISSTAFQWAMVAGQASHNTTIWDASALNADMAALFCAEGKDFGGGGTELIAYVEQYETVVACGDAGAP